ncbi:MAG: IS66 family transposase [Candidatus Brocadiae bacterium]|nr:IS66 family transposase [Candidatus Brocadiia bacterium]
MTTVTTPAPTSAALPDDPSVLRATIEGLSAQLAEAKKRIQALQHQIDLLRRSTFGRKSEKLVVDQLLLAFAGLQGEVGRIEQAQAKAEEAIEARVEEKTPGHGRRVLPRDLPRETIVVTVPEGDRSCATCGGPCVTIGFDEAERLEYTPATFKVQVVRREKIACKPCQANVVTADPPPQPLEKALPGPRLIAHIITNKYADHLPLYRQEAIFARCGFKIARSTMVGWLIPAAALLKPIADAMFEEILLSRAINSDETPVPVLDPLLDQTREGRLWVYCGDRDHPHLGYKYSPDRRGEHPARHLADYAGFLIADAYAGYDAIFKAGRIREVLCWAHVRRKFYDSRTTDALSANIALAWISKLYDVEKLAHDMSHDDRKSLRQTDSAPILADFKTWLDEAALEILPSSPMGQAIAYATRNWPALELYIQHGFLPIDNNAAERALRCVAVGRKNWEFAGSDEGGHRAAIFYTLVSTCKLHGVDPEAYLADVLMRVATTPARNIADLFPLNWAKARLADTLAAAKAVAEIAR